MSRPERSFRTIEHVHSVGNMNPSLSSLHVLSETEVLSVGARTLNRKDFPPGLIAYALSVQITELKVWNMETGELSRDLTAGRFDVGLAMWLLCQTIEPQFSGVRTSHVL